MIIGSSVIIHAHTENALGRQTGKPFVYTAHGPTNLPAVRSLNLQPGYLYAITTRKVREGFQTEWVWYAAKPILPQPEGSTLIGFIQEPTIS